MLNIVKKRRQKVTFTLQQGVFCKKKCIFVPKYPSLRKRRMGQTPILCFNRIADILDKDHKMPKGKTKNNRTPSWCKKRLGRLSRHYVGGSFDNGI